MVGYVVRMILEQRQASLDTTITDDKIRYRRVCLLVWGSGGENGCLLESLLQLLLRAGFVHTTVSERRGRPLVATAARTSWGLLDWSSGHPTACCQHHRRSLAAFCFFVDRFGLARPMPEEARGVFVRRAADPPGVWTHAQSRNHTGYVLSGYPCSSCVWQVWRACVSDQHKCQ